MQGKFNMTDEEYFSHPYLSNSGIGKILKSINHFIKPEKKETKSMDLGKLFHLMILEPHKFESSFVIKPEIDSRTKEFKEWKASQVDKIIIDKDDLFTLNEMKLSLLNHSKAQNIFGSGESESVYLSQYRGVGIKAKIDHIAKGVLFDLKTSRDASKDGFTRSIGAYHYYRQASHYLTVAKNCGIEASAFCFVVVENCHPFNTSTFLLTEDALDIGFKEMDKGIDKWLQYQNASEENKKKLVGYSDEFETISAPNWSFYNAGEI